jgi:Holliday junction resolvasome RuvABC endonuclease subunit
MAITGYGTADKQAVYKMLTLMLGKGIVVADDDESDAIACALAYCLLITKV